MNFELDHQDDFLIIRLSGVARPNERLLIKKSLDSSLRLSDRNVIVDLKDLETGDAVYFVGVLKAIQKEVQLMGGRMKLCCVPAVVVRYFQENRLDRMFDVEPCVEKAKRSFLEERND
jgi:anti-anti-sigma factor